jgi:hypothetical protein
MRRRSSILSKSPRNLSSVTDAIFIVRGFAGVEGACPCDAKAAARAMPPMNVRKTDADMGYLVSEGEDRGRTVRQT